MVLEEVWRDRVVILSWDIPVDLRDLDVEIIRVIDDFVFKRVHLHLLISGERNRIEFKRSVTVFHLKIGMSFNIAKDEDLELVGDDTKIVGNMNLKAN